MCDRVNLVQNPHEISAQYTPSPNYKVKNPFERVLISKLHKSICSPGMCKRYKPEDNGGFEWEIHQKCEIAPVDINPCNSQFEPSPDPVIERIAEEASERYFSQETILPSPMDFGAKSIPLQTSSAGNIELVNEPLDKDVYIRDASAQTVLTIPPQLPEELEKLLGRFMTFTEDQQTSNDSLLNVSLRRKLYFEEHQCDFNDYDSERSEESEREIHRTPKPQSINYKQHTPLQISPTLECNVVSKGMQRTFGTPLNNDRHLSNSEKMRNKMFHNIDLGDPFFSPIVKALQTPTSSSSNSSHPGTISPVQKISSSSEDEKNTSPESEAMASCLNCVSKSDSKETSPCYCKATPKKSLLGRSKSFKDSFSYRNSVGSLAGKRSASMSSLNRSRSVQKLDFSHDMSIDDESLRCHSVLAGSDSSTSPYQRKECWQMEMSKIEKILDHRDEELHQIKETPVRGRHKSHLISRILSDKSSPMNMSLDASIDSSDENPLHLEDKKLDFDSIDLQTISHNIDSHNPREGSSLRRFDSGFNENSTFHSKPSDSTLTDSGKSCSGIALKEITNWMRVDSGFRDDTSSDQNMYPEHSEKERQQFFSFARPSKVNEENKENVFDDFDKFLERASTRHDCMSMSDVFTDEMAMNCNYSSTPSKQKNYTQV